MIHTILALFFSMNLQADVVAPGGAQFAETNNAPVMTPIQPNNGTGSYYDWGRAQNGYGFCYQWTNDGYVLNGGNPVANHLCEEVNPSHYYWGRAQNGYGFCYQFTPQGWVLNMGNPVTEFSCEQVAPSYYAWGRGMDGYTYCYHFTPNGYVMNMGSPVSNSLCN